MATAFDRWEKDPFFYAAEEVQESSDRMESVYRRWMIHEKRPGGGVKDLSAAELRRELHTALGTAKWQLEELERAVKSSDHALSSGEDTVTRHSDFIVAISSKISMVEKALKELNVEDRRSALEWVRLDEIERDELALFLSYPKSKVEKVLPTSSGDFPEAEHIMNGESSVSLNCCQSNNFNTLDMKEGKMKDHQSVASACADLGVWKTSVSTERSPHKLLNEQPPPRIFNLSQFRTVEAITKPNWYRNGFRKCRILSNEDMMETIPLQNNQLSRDMDACYAKSKSCLSDCTDESYNKQLYGWLGAFQRQIQRSQYHVQYRRPIQMIIWTIVTVFLIAWLMLKALLNESRVAYASGFQWTIILSL
ncbi:uncharacterized protein LOC110096179 isoform X1 [Dendrobium catenatum]|uniref:uncharacterized protein LOC110096179 isoform X1 n=1 Tax=Dendrobium catenatum TaxID=906689 RepID=UPI0009F1A25E|nr:uncharacterized protein LOC110096179 isoform X1 [Dendrobium catenatum]